VFRILYDTALQSYQLGARVASLVSPKAEKWIAGRAQQDLSNVNLNKPIWIHCASLGEFEQGRPIIEKIKQLHPSQDIVLTFFSPSGYEIRKNYAQADEVLYLPLDQKGNAHDFLDAIDPSLAIFVKYDFWYHYLATLTKRSIPFVVIAAHFRSGHFLFKRVMRPLLSLLKSAQAIFVQSPQSLETLEGRGFKNALVAGDPRIDRVLDSNPDSQICSELALSQYEKVIVFGSLWLEDLDVVRSWIRQAVADSKTFVIIAPHDIAPKTLRLMEHNSGLETRLSQVRAGSPLDAKGLIVDTIGDLSSLYRCASLAYIGGGFGHGIHNILEPAAAHIPIIFGPKHTKFPEANDLIALHCAFAVQSAADLAHVLHQLEDDTVRAEIASQMATYLEGSRGATDTIVDWLFAHNFISA